MKKTAYRLTAEIGDLKRGAVIELTDEKAASPLYASRITPAESGAAVVTVDVGAIRAELRNELLAELDEAVKGARENAEKLVADAQAEAKKIVEAAQAEAMKLAAGAGKK